MFAFYPSCSLLITPYTMQLHRLAREIFKELLTLIQAVLFVARDREEEKRMVLVIRALRFRLQVPSKEMTIKMENKALVITFMEV